ncbi:protein-tyrosine phosphatase family protein [Crateriforma spongiae]|uniref:hypothetical protein n=1 Tax=Crateriforma spongiae TaxID=2724528 RepID=UPI001448550A|nr:hypothetical protein [Crateriforma spongiae]
MGMFLGQTFKAAIAAVMLFIFIGNTLIAHSAADQPEKNASVPRPQRMPTRYVPNLVQLHDRVFSGGLPENDEAFAELAALGIRTVISVDAALPDVDAAERQGLRYVHLPHGYDGIPTERSLELAQAVNQLPAPIYIHCHHGKHRSPAAAAVACLGAGLINKNQADQTLRIAGTGPQYRGLFASVADAHPLSDAVLNQSGVAFPSIADVPAMAQLMVDLETRLSHLRRIAANDWEPPANHPDLDKDHQALLLMEAFVEADRIARQESLGDDFVEQLQRSIANAKALRQAVTRASLDRSAAATSLRRIEEIAHDCRVCHQQFRDVPSDH